MAAKRGEVNSRMERAEIRMIRWMCGVSLKERRFRAELRRRLGVQTIEECHENVQNAMAIGHGDWTWRLDMAIGHGDWTWRLDMAIGHGDWTWRLGKVIYQVGGGGDSSCRRTEELGEHCVG